MKKIFGFGIKERTPLGFCDGNRSTSLQSGNENIDSHYWRNFYAKYKPKEKLHKAASTGKVEKLVSILDSGKIHVDNRDKKNRTALHFACACGHVKVVTFLIANDCEIDLCDSDNSTALIKAVQCQEEECATILLKHGADSNIEDVSGFTALHYAVCNGNSPMVTKLLAYNANIEAKTKDYLTPFLLALRESKVHVADLLIRKGANIHALDEFRRNALMYAVRCESKDMIALLLQRGIEVSHQDGFGWTALQYAAASRSRIWNILLNYEEHELNNLQENNTASSSSEDNSLTRCSDEPFPQVFSSISKQGDGNSHSKSISESFPEKSIANFLGDEKQIGENTEDQMEVWAETWKPTTARTNSLPTKALGKKNQPTLQSEPVSKMTLKKEQNQYDGRKDIRLLEVSESLPKKIVGPFPGTADQAECAEKCSHWKPTTPRTNSVPTKALAKKNEQTVQSAESVTSDEERKSCHDRRDSLTLEISESHPQGYGFQLPGESGKPEANRHMGGTYIARTSEEKQKCDGSKNNRHLNINLITLDQWKAMQESKKNENIYYSDVINSGVKNKDVTETSCQSSVQIRSLSHSTCSMHDQKEVATEMNNETEESTSTSQKKINNDNLSAESKHQNNRTGLKEEINEDSPWDSESLSSSLGPNCVAHVIGAAEPRADNMVKGLIRESPKMHPFMKLIHFVTEEKDGVPTKALVEKDAQTLQSGLNEENDEGSPWDSESISEFLGPNHVTHVAGAANPRGDNMVERPVRAMSTLGFKEEEEEASPWDSESISENLGLNRVAHLTGTGAPKEDSTGKGPVRGLKEEEDEESPWDSESMSEYFVPNYVAHLTGASDPRRDNMVKGPMTESPKVDSSTKPNQPATDEKDGVIAKTLLKENAKALQSVGLKKEKEDASFWDSENISENRGLNCVACITEVANPGGDNMVKEPMKESPKMPPSRKEKKDGISAKAFVKEDVQILQSGLKEEKDEEKCKDIESISERVRPNHVAHVTGASDPKGENKVKGPVRESPKFHLSMKPIQPVPEKKNGIPAKALVKEVVQILQPGLKEEEDKESPWNTKAISEYLGSNSVTHLTEAADPRTESVMKGPVRKSTRMHSSKKSIMPPTEKKVGVPHKTIAKKAVQTLQSGLKEENNEEAPWNIKIDNYFQNISASLGPNHVALVPGAGDPKRDNMVKGSVKESPKMLSSMKKDAIPPKALAKKDVQMLQSESANKYHHVQPIIEKKGSTTTKANTKQDKELFKSDLSADLELRVTLEKSGKRFDSENNHTQIKEKMKIHKSNEMEVAENPSGDGAVATETGILHRKSEKAHCQQFPDQEIEEHDGLKKEILVKENKDKEKVKTLDDPNILTQLSKLTGKNFTVTDSEDIFKLIEQFYDYCKEKNKNTENQICTLQKKLSNQKKVTKQLQREKMELEGKLYNLRFNSKQEAMKRKDASCLCGKNKEMFHEREEHCNKEARARQVEIYLGIEGIELKTSRSYFNPLQEAKHQHTEAVQNIEETHGYLQRSELPNPKLKVTMKKLARKTEQLQTTLQMTEEDKEQLNKFLEIKACLERCLEKKRKENTELEKDLTRFKKYFEESGTENINSCSVNKKNPVTQKPEDCEEEMRGRNVKVQGINEDPGTYSEASKAEEDQQRVWNWHPAPMTGGRESGRPQSKCGDDEGLFKKLAKLEKMMKCTLEKEKKKNSEIENELVR
ncbi:ankyrin repeat domain-containing protein 26-like isoform X2 [Dipodomys merriami]|uniref:ankyrin repeat domain-containing protein 26-like isoform X2 n=1 Tax=Dipodomys merriami TaxID=94247 RepID=UPI003855AD76